MEWNKFNVTRFNTHRDWSLFKHLSEEVKTGNDNAAQIQMILERHSFETHFYDGEKLRVLTDNWYLMHSGIRNDMHKPLIDSVLKGDNIRILRALLPLIPICRVARGSLPRHFPWQDQEEIEQTIRFAQGRWWPEFVARRCKKDSHLTPSDLEESYPLIKSASDALGAELFKRCMEYEACEFPTRCALYLLAVCPQLLAIRGFNCKGIAAKLFAIPALGEVFLDRSIMQYLGHSIEEIMDSLIDTPKHSKSHMDYMKVFLSIAGSLFREKILNSEKDESFLHAVCTRFQSASEERLFCIAHLMKLGFDPERRNRGRMTAVDLLTSEFFDNPWHRYIVKAQGVEDPHRVSAMLLLNVNAMLPYFSAHSPVPGITLPQLATFHSIEDFKQGLVKIWQVFIDVDVFPRSSVENLSQILNNGIIDGVDMEEALALLVHRELSKGLDVASQRHVLAGFDEGHRITLSGWLMRHLQGSYDKWRRQFPFIFAGGNMPVNRRILHNLYNLYNLHNPHNPHNLSAEPGAASDAQVRYWWQTLELIVHSNRGLGYLSVRGLFNILGREGRNGEFIPWCLSAVRQVIRMLWLYVPRTKRRIDSFLQKLALSPDPNAQKTATDLQNMMSRFPSLQLLTRRCIVRRVQFQDIARLPLPTLLKHYLQVGEISPDHPIVAGLGLEKLKE